MVIMLDIIEDFLHHRRYTYERLDGRIRGIKKERERERGREREGEGERERERERESKSKRKKANLSSLPSFVTKETNVNVPSIVSAKDVSKTFVLFLLSTRALMVVKAFNLTAADTVIIYM
jgi:hypothetical protein